jgi:hypothetical protein
MDPVGVQLEKIHSFNRYHYANSNPYKYIDPDGEEGQWADGNYWDFEAETMGMDARVGRAYQNLGKNIAENLETSPALIVGTGTVGIAAALAKSTLKKGITVIGHLPDYPKIAEKMGANFLKPSKDWNFKKQGEFIKDVIKRGDDVFIGTPIRQGPSVLKKEIKQLVKHGYRLLEQSSKWLIKE